MAARLDYFEGLKREFKEDVQEELRLRAKIDKSLADNEACFMHYNAMQLENENLKKLLDQEVSFRHQIGGRIVHQLGQFRQDFENVIKQMDDVLNDFDAEKTAEHNVIVETYQAFKAIPKAFSDEVITTKTIEIDQKIATMTKSIEELTIVKDKLNDSYMAEKLSSAQLDENIYGFVNDLKKIIVTMNRFVHKK